MVIKCKQDQMTSMHLSSHCWLLVFHAFLVHFWLICWTWTKQHVCWLRTLFSSTLVADVFAMLCHCQWLDCDIFASKMLVFDLAAMSFKTLHCDSALLMTFSDLRLRLKQSFVSFHRLLAFLDLPLYQEGASAWTVHFFHHQLEKAKWTHACDSNPEAVESKKLKRPQKERIECLTFWLVQNKKSVLETCRC